MIIGITLSASLKPILAQQDGTGPANGTTPATGTTGPVSDTAERTLTYDPDVGFADGNTNFVRIVFKGYESYFEDQSAWICPYTDENVCEIKTEESAKYVFKKVDFKDGDVVIEKVCGDGKDKVKIEGDCQSGRDYFWEGQWYKVGLYTVKGTTVTQIAQQQFFVHHFYPKVTLKGASGDIIIEKNPEYHADSNRNDALIITPSNEEDFNEIYELQDPYVEIKLDGYKLPTNKQHSDRNNFQIVVEGRGGELGDSEDEGEICYTIRNKNVVKQENMHGFIPIAWHTKNDKNETDRTPLLPGNYLLKISEQINDSSEWKRDDNCQGGFTYYQIPFTVTLDNGEIKATFQKNGVEIDPNYSDFRKFNSEIVQTSLPCIKGVTKDGKVVDKRADPDADSSQIVKCELFSTAIGDFAPRPIEFIQSLTKLLLGIGAMATLAYLVYGGFLILTSRGDKEKIQKAREMITSAILGLTFIFFSFVILAFIGVDVLGLDRFTR